MNAHWIEVKEGRWKMKSAVIGFKGIMGSHTGENLGRYAVGLLDHVGIMNNKESKVGTCHNPDSPISSYSCAAVHCDIR